MLFRSPTAIACLSKPFYGRPPNNTHHFHRYRKAVDAAHTLAPTYSPRSWEIYERMKKSRRRMTIDVDDLDPAAVAQAVAGDHESRKETRLVTDTREEEENRDVLDLYVCCQCILYVLVSDVIPGDFPAKYMKDFYRERYDNLLVGSLFTWLGKQFKREHVTSFLICFSQYGRYRAIENKLWKGNDKALVESFPQK